jgi:hypothetical protein
VAAAATLAVPLVLAALAWACSPQSAIQLSQQAGFAGNNVEVSGSNFANGGSVEIHWNSASGPLLATATGPTFAVTVTVPEEASADNHLIVAVGQATAQFPEVHRPASFTVVEPAPAPENAPAREAPPRNGTAGTTSGGGSPGGALTRRATAGAPSPASAVGGAGDTAAGTDPITSSAPATAEAGGSGAPAAATAGGARNDAGSPSEAASRPAAPRGSAAADLWGGFEAATARGLPSSAAAPAAPESSLPLLSVAMLGFGLVAVFSGAAVAAVRRRRAPAQAQRRSTSD